VPTAAAAGALYVSAENARESGKAILESRGEVGRAIALLQYYGVEGANPVGAVVPSVNPNILLYTNRFGYACSLRLVRPKKITPFLQMKAYLPQPKV
jgi:hypothetical protein